MSSPSSFFILKTKWYRLGLRFLLCLFCFIIGCSFGGSFISSIECTRSGKTTSTERATRQNAKLEKRTLVTLILSAPQNIVKRHALRRTWLSLAEHESMKYYFVIGSKNVVGDKEETLLTEERHYSDLLILSDVEESYDLLTSKLISSFLWIDKSIDFDFLLKVDDDSYVDIRRLHKELTKKVDLKKLYWGYFNGRAKVQQRGKWKEKDWNICDSYLPYARGGGYVISRELVHFIAQNAGLLSIYKNEDVSVGAWLAPLNITRVHDVRFDTEWASRGCSNEYLITHPQDMTELYKLHETLLNSGRLCHIEFKKRPAYLYDWSVVPSKCCSKLTS